MMTALVSGVFGFFVAVAIWVVIRVMKRKRGAPGSSVKVFASIEHLRSVGELVVFKIITKEIVTSAEHWFGEGGKKYFQWLVSARKMAMIFEFEIDFRYDLQSPEFMIEEKKDGQYLLKMPRHQFLRRAEHETSAVAAARPAQQSFRDRFHRGRQEPPEGRSQTAGGADGRKSCPENEVRGPELSPKDHGSAGEEFRRAACYLRFHALGAYPFECGGCSIGTAGRTLETSDLPPVSVPL
jgi:hypothetical protein